MNLGELQYLFDLQGYVVIEDVLSQSEVDVLTSRIETQNIEPSNGNQRFGSAPEGAGFLNWGQAFCNLMDHPVVLPALQLRLGECFRLDRILGIHMDRGMTGWRLHSDYGASAPRSGATPGNYFPFRPEIPNDGFVVVTWNLTDSGGPLGGFRCVPGSHKSNYLLPNRILQHPEEAACVVTPWLPRGSVLLFSETLTHGTGPWFGSERRRALLFKYCISQMAWSSSQITSPSFSLTAIQERLLLPPAEPYCNFPSLFE